ncbi:MAG: hypothetical protein H0X51_06140 [Parachlamydiaceae bacterium]|nr:hypothetical protein [Parachlamydiaceae bacterium]
MTHQNKNQDDDIWVSLSDFFLYCKQEKRTILLSVFGLVLFVTGYILTNPVQYLSQASFREKNGSSGMVTNSSSLTAALLGGTKTANNSEIVSTMKSRLMIERLIHELNLQGTLEKKVARFPMLANIRDNLKAEWANLRKRKGPLLKENPLPIAVQALSYNEETSRQFQIQFNNDSSFLIWPSRKADPMHAKLGDEITIDTVRFTLVRTDSSPLTGETFLLNVEPLYTVVERVLARLTIETDREDKSLIRLKYLDTDRYRAAASLNALMQLYRTYLKEEQSRVSDEQLAYLETRQGEMKEVMRHMMEQHAAVLSSDVMSLGFPDVSSAIHFFAAIQQKYTQDLLTIDLELKRVQRDTSVYFEQSGDANTINPILTRIRDLKRQADSIELALGESVEQNNVAQKLEALADVERKFQETKSVIASLAKDEKPNHALKIFEDPKYQLTTWYEQLSACRTAEEKHACSEHFLAYLSHLKHLLFVHGKALQDQIVHQRNTSQEFQGIDLDTARDLYINYSRDLNVAEADESQTHFIIKQMQDPAFEISSLSSILQDDVSKKMISQASALVLSLKDENNRSEREQERARAELAVQKGFLSEHLNQTIQLQQLRQSLLKDKIRSLQTATLGLIQQELSVLDKHLSDYMATRQEQLLDQRVIIEQHQRELQQEMAKLSSKWVSEKLIDQQMEMNARMVEEITKLVESKNTSSNLDLIQSAPVDIAIPALQPNPPKIVLFAVLGACLGVVLSVSSIFVRNIATGLPVTESSLRHAKQSVLGTLSNLYQKTPTKSILPDHDLEILRQLTQFLKSHSDSNGGQIATLILNSNKADYSTNLAQLLAKQGSKVLLLPLVFDQPADEQILPGMLQYLDGEVSGPKIIKGQMYDTIAPGGPSRYAYELIQTVRFQQLLSAVKQEYDWILLKTYADVKSAEVNSLLHTSEYAVVTITNQKWDDIKEVMRWSTAQDSGKHLSFLFA